jgi:serine/threonine-protein kinase
VAEDAVTGCVLDDRYTLIERIAIGGMSEVWRGDDQLLDRPVAIKILAAAYAADEQSRARFRAEARYASSLTHPGITKVFDHGDYSPLGGPYLVMELVDGLPLSDVIARCGRVDPSVVLDIIVQAARALDAAHGDGIVHRDIKPSNLLITADGTTKITDFGIAKETLSDVSLTQTGLVMGTALYISPEQASGQRVSGASDLYSLGVVAYECLAGAPPFVADEPLALAIMHKHEPVPPLPDDVPRPIADLVYAMLAKDPGNRLGSARHVADRADIIREARNRYPGTTATDLPAVPSSPPAARPDLHQTAPERVPAPRRPDSRPFLLAGGGAAAIGAIAIVAVLISSGGSSSALHLGNNTVLPTQTQAQPARPMASGHASTTGPVSNLGGGYSVNVLSTVVPHATGPTSTPSPSKSPAASKSPTASESATPTASPTTTPTTAAPTTAAPTTTAPTTAPPTTTAPTTAPPTTTAPTTAAPTTPTTTPPATPTATAAGG